MDKSDSKRLDATLSVHEYVVRALNKKHDMQVWVQPKLRFLLREWFSGKSNTWIHDMGVCSDCGFHKMWTTFDLYCHPATAATIHNCINTCHPGTKKIYIPIRVYVGHKTKPCKANFGAGLHANGLVIDLDKKTMSVFDPNGMPKLRSAFYTKFFSNIAEELQKLHPHSKKYEYKVAHESCGFAHAGLCRYAVFLKALELNLGVNDFMTFVLNCLEHLYRVVTLTKARGY